MKKFLVFLLFIILGFSLISCSLEELDFLGDTTDTHKHVYAGTWSKNETHHWHDAICEHKEEKTDYEEHTFGAWSIRTEATETTDGLEFRICSVCSYEETRTIPALGHTHTFADTWTKDATSHWHASTCGHDVKEDVENHTFDEWTIRTEATETTDGLEFRTCSVCGYEDTKIIYATVHTHTYSDTWASDETSHWHATTCGHDEKKDIASHTYVSNVVAPVGKEQGYTEHVCSVCNYSYRDNYTVIIDFYAINDLHGVVTESNTSAGISKTATYLKNQQEIQNVVVVSQGDMFQGTYESNSNRGNLISEWMREIGCVSMTYGNHEFDWGTSGMYENMELAGFPFLGINIFYNSKGAHPGERVDYASPSIVVEVSGVKIGIIGAIGNCLSSISGEMSQDIYFATGDELTNLVKAESTRLIEEENCDFIVYSIHGSGRYDDEDSYDETLSTLGYVDVVFEGHTHSQYDYQDTGYVYHLQGSAYGKGLYHYQVVINSDTDESSVTLVEYVQTKSNMSSLSTDPNVDYLINEKYDVSSAYEVIGHNDEYKNSSQLRQIIADEYLRLGQEKWPNYDIILGGGYISCRTPGYLPVGDVTFAQINQLFPFENDVVLCSIDGYHLKRQFLNSTNSNYFISCKAGVSSSSIDDNKTYYIVTDTYSSTYDANGCTEIARYSSEGYYQCHIIRDYIIRNDSSQSHTHTYSNDWDYDSEQHYHSATCGHNERIDVANHDFVTSVSNNVITYTCTVCGYEKYSYVYTTETKTPAEIVEIGNNLASGEQTSVTYRVEGVITSTSFYSGYCNFYLGDLYIYGLFNEDGINYGTRDGFIPIPEELVAGKTVILYGYVMNYNGTKIELVNSVLISISD